MSRDNRTAIEKAEMFVVDLINQRENEWVEHSYAIADEILKNYNDIEEVEHIGNTYSNNEIGDIKIRSSNSTEWIYIELKMSQSRTGRGTVANISQNALTNSNLFEGNNITGWSDFREENAFRDRISSVLNRYNNYPDDCSGISKRGEYLRNTFQELTQNTQDISRIVSEYTQESNPDISEIATIINEIVNIARNDKLAYIQYLRGLNQNTELIKKFTISILLGYHTMEQLNYILSIPYQEIYNLLERYYVYYTNIRDDSIIVTKEELGPLVREIISNDLIIYLPDNRTNCIIQNDNGDNILRIVFHWKNIFQGILTPCLNIFKNY
jgi:hypothetical protein